VNVSVKVPLLITVPVMVVGGPSEKSTVALNESFAGAVQASATVTASPVCPVVGGELKLQVGGGVVVEVVFTTNAWALTPFALTVSVIVPANNAAGAL
jgi:hypothetical protein